MEIRVAADVEEDPSQVVELEWGENKRIRFRKDGANYSAEYKSVEIPTFHCTAS
jgi:hypothetical protein